MPRDVTETELAILQVLWDQKTASRRQITDVLYPDGGPAQYATVQKLLERLEAKRLVRHLRGRDGVLQFTATVAREEFISRRLLDMAERLCGGSLTPLLMNLIRAKPLDAQELSELRKLIKELSQQNRPKSGKS
jgi:BlaI family transcriptional regulator, penicillinase repressor